MHDYTYRATDRSSDRASEQSIERSSERAIERSSERSSDRASDRAIKRASDRAIERSSDRAIARAIERSSERSSDRATKYKIKTRAPEVHLTRRLVHSARFFKTKTSKTLPRLNSIQKSSQIQKVIKSEFRHGHFRTFQIFKIEFRCFR